IYENSRGLNTTSNVFIRNKPWLASSLAKSFVIFVFGLVHQDKSLAGFWRWRQGFAFGNGDFSPGFPTFWTNYAVLSRFRGLLTRLVHCTFGFTHSNILSGQDDQRSKRF
ncbi:MAG TPA: hypothetical protein PKZ26_10745, partial [Anaerolineaceae bacterium]|nr:hypothetical protein [Anaerolineaceae bacterium]